ncbi:MAG: hypothetical protein JWP81_814 [Ferruginibacter sp.]|nr:hypothetical protein [Ferruginibacter sp.]
MPVKNILYQSVLWRGLFYITVFLLNVLIARHFGAMLSGIVYYLISIYSLILLGTGLSLESGITYFIAKDEIDPGKLLLFSSIWAILVGTLALIICSYFAPQYYDLPGNVLLFSVFTFICGNLLLSYATGFFYAKNNYVVPNSINIIINIVLIVLLPNHMFSIFHFVTNENYFYFYFGSFFLQGLILTIAIKLKYSRHLYLRLPRVQEVKLLMTYCLTAYVSNLVFFFLYRIDYWFVNRYCTAEDLGTYIQVSKIGQLFFVLPTILATVIFPLAAGNKHLLKEVLTLLSRSLLWLYVVICLFLVLFGSSLFPVIFGKSFGKMYGCFLFLIPGIVCLSMLYTLTAYYAGKNRISVNTNGALMALAVVITGDYLFIPKYGINAAALISSIGYLVYLLFVLRIFVKEYDVTWSSFFVMKNADFDLLYNKIINRNKLKNEG